MAIITMLKKRNRKESEVCVLVGLSEKSGCVRGGWIDGGLTY